MSTFGIVLHGGAGTILRERMSPEKEKAYRAGLEEALNVGHGILLNKGTALDAAEATVCALEDNPLYNAGRGAVFAGDGTQRFDASIMCGESLRAGSVADIRSIRNPIRFARLIMEKSAYVMMVGQDAEAFAHQHNLPTEAPEYFYDQLRYDQWLEIRDTAQTQLDHAHKGEKNWSTVGAVALDQHGNLAAATSTGGMTNKRFGRVGDSPIIGSGTYADNARCAVCCTGHGEPFMRVVVAHELSALVAHKGLSLADAAHELVQQRLVNIKGEGGLIAINKQGDFVMEFNCAGMYRAARMNHEPAYIGIYKDE